MRTRTHEAIRDLKPGEKLIDPDFKVAGQQFTASPILATLDNQGIGWEPMPEDMRELGEGPGVLVLYEDLEGMEGFGALTDNCNPADALDMLRELAEEDDRIRILTTEQSRFDREPGLLK